MTDIQIEVVTFACQEHKHQVYEAVKHHLVVKGLWYPDGLSMDLSSEDRCHFNKKCFCGKPASHIIKYKIPLKVKA